VSSTGYIFPFLTTPKLYSAHAPLRRKAGRRRRSRPHLISKAPLPAGKRQPSHIPLPLPNDLIDDIKVRSYTDITGTCALLHTHPHLLAIARLSVPSIMYQQDYHAYDKNINTTADVLVQALQPTIVMKRL
jgi:hypothetical protein